MPVAAALCDSLCCPNNVGGKTKHFSFEYINIYSRQEDGGGGSERSHDAALAISTNLQIKCFLCDGSLCQRLINGFNSAAAFECHSPSDATVLPPRI